MSPQRQARTLSPILPTRRSRKAPPRVGLLDVLSTLIGLVAIIAII